MKVVITGAAGFLGSKLADALLQDQQAIKELVLVDIRRPAPRSDTRVNAIALELGAPGVAEALITPDTNVLFHLAAIVSGHAEADFDLGFNVNFDVTRSLLEAAKHQAPNMKLVFTSTAGVFGGNFPPILNEMTATTPQNSYGTAKAMSELLINDYSRKGFVDGRVVRLPTVSVRAGSANLAVTSFASGIVREPLNGEVAVCPVSEDLELWLSSPETVIKNIIHIASLPRQIFGPWRVVNLPGITVSVKDMVQALRKVAGDKVASLVKFERDEAIDKIVRTFPVKFDNARALNLGFTVDGNYEDIIRAYIRDDLRRQL